MQYGHLKNVYQYTLSLLNVISGVYWHSFVRPKTSQNSWHKDFKPINQTNDRSFSVFVLFCNTYVEPHISVKWSWVNKESNWRRHYISHKMLKNYYRIIFRSFQIILFIKTKTVVKRILWTRLKESKLCASLSVRNFC